MTHLSILPAFSSIPAFHVSNSLGGTRRMNRRSRLIGMLNIALRVQTLARISWGKGRLLKTPSSGDDEIHQVHFM